MHGQNHIKKATCFLVYLTILVGRLQNKLAYITLIGK